MRTQPMRKEESSFIGIDYHKRYSVFCVLDAQGGILERGRIDHGYPEQFVLLVRRWPGCRVVFEACMNWHWLLEILEEAMPREEIVLANPWKTRIIAEAQIKTDKVDARLLADLLRGNLIARVHICGQATREVKEMLRQRCFFVRQRTMIRNRIHRLLGAQHGLRVPQCSDLFAAKGLSFLDKLELPAPAGLLLTQQLALLRELLHPIPPRASLPRAREKGTRKRGFSPIFYIFGESACIVSTGDHSRVFSDRNVYGCRDVRISRVMLLLVDLLLRQRLLSRLLCP